MFSMFHCQTESYDLFFSVLLCLKFICIFVRLYNFYFFRNVSNPNASLVLTVMDREDNIGNITLPVINLPSAAHKRRWLPLQRKHQETTSDLCFDCWITQFKKETVWNKFNPFFSTNRR